MTNGPAKSNGMRVAIIGSGPAGLGAAIYGKRAGYSTLVLEKNPMSGGQVLNTCEVDNYLGLPGINGFDLGMLQAEQQVVRLFEFHRQRYADRSGVEQSQFGDDPGVAAFGQNSHLVSGADAEREASPAPTSNACSLVSA